MAEKFSFFNSVNGDRTYNAEDFVKYLGSVMTTGILNGGVNLQVVSNNNYTITLKKGKAFIEGYYYELDEDKTFTIDVADSSLNRKDAIIIKLDKTNRTINAQLKKGVPASSPVAYTVSRTETVYEIKICDITINKAASLISQSNITDTRLNNAVCGLVSTKFDADTTGIFNQIQTYFNEKKNEVDVDLFNLFEDYTNQMNQKFDDFENTKAEKITSFDEMQNEKSNGFEEWVDSIKSQIENDDHAQINEKIEANALNILKVIDEQYQVNNRKTIDITNTDLNNLPSSGSGLFSGTNLTNSPDVSKLYQIEQIVHNAGNHVVQTIHQANTSIKYFRNRNELNEWSNWEKVFVKSDVMVDASNKNLNTFSENTTFFSGLNMQNAPSEFYYSGFQIRYEGNQGKIQFVIRNSTIREVWFRIYSNSWTNWSKLHHDVSVQGGEEQITITDANTVYAKKVFFKNSFSAKPAIQVTANTSGPANCSASWGNATKTEFDIYFQRTNVVSPSVVTWLAMEKTQ